MHRLRPEFNRCPAIKFRALRFMDREFRIGKIIAVYIGSLKRIDSTGTLYYNLGEIHDAFLSSI